MFLPEGLLAHFDVVSSHILGDVQTKKDCFYIYLDEKNILPEPYSSKDYESKGFYRTSLFGAKRSIYVSKDVDGVIRPTGQR